ncbi:MAG: hypothetical protein ACI8ZM_004779 [Crocinitomix sp.]|jgi:hypothetical protein
MKKTYFLLALLFLCPQLMAQTETNLTCYGWSADLNDVPLPAAIVMEGYDQDVIDAEDALNAVRKDQPWRFGYKYDTNISLENSGSWTDVTDGRVWRTLIECTNAQTINLLLEDFYLPAGATLYLYDFERTNKIGAYTAKNNRIERELGTELIHGETIIVEYFEPFAVIGEGSFTISNVIHGYRSLDRIQKDLEKGLNDSGNCNIDVNCPLGDDWDDQIRSVAMIVVSGNGICTGALINNTCEDGRFLFLTANHCLGGSTANWSFRFNWNSPSGTESCATVSGSTDPGAPYDQTANGATVLASSGGSDFGLLEIDNMTEDEAEEWNVHYAGWDNSDAETVTEATGIHHPSGDLKKICREDNDPYHDATGGAQVWWIDDWDQGVTEPGSSGSPLFDQNGRIIGQLYGGAAACGGGDGTDDNDAYDFYGRLGVSWGLGASTYLAPDGCGDATTLDGIDAGGEDCSGSISSDPTNALCFGETSGEVDVTVSGGDAPYTFNIGDGPVASGLFTGLGAGDYTVTVIDDAGCEDNVYITIGQPSELDALYSTSDEISGSDGSINITVIGGTPSFTYDWDGPGGFTSTDQDVTGLVAGVYEVEITDGNGCIHVEDNMTVNSQLSLNEYAIGVDIYPNPTQGLFTISIENNTSFDVKVYDISGRTAIATVITTSNSIELDLTNNAAGTYFIELITEDGKIVERLIKN